MTWHGFPANATEFARSDYFANNFNDLASAFVVCFEMLLERVGSRKVTARPQLSSLLDKYLHLGVAEGPPS